LTDDKAKDYKIVLIIGFFIGIMSLMPLWNIGVKFSPIIAVLIVLGCSAFAVACIFVLKFVARYAPIFNKFGKFAATGTLNTVLDLSVLNVLMLIGGVASGWKYAVFKAFSFIVTTTNSYMWNKFWTFKSRVPVSAKEYTRFAAFTFVGMFVNVSVASVIVNAIGAPSGVSENAWANVGAIAAVAVSFLCNFLSYNNIVFRKK